MPVLSAIESKRLYRQIADVIAQHIDAGDFPPGSLLPAERDLAQQMRVSRTSIREALIALEVEGKVSVRVGTGVFVLAAPVHRASRGAAPPEALDWSDVGPLQIVEARRVVECEAAALAARAATDADVANLRKLLKGLEAELQAKREHYPKDRAFHLEIARLSGNHALVLMVAQLWSLRATALARRFEKHFSTEPLYTDVNHDHRAIFNAIEARDSRAARLAMKRHLDRVHRAYTIALA
jgi:DNA-binding FadR family transcriptional regulator